jgi:hypothetical protein
VTSSTADRSAGSQPVEAVALDLAPHDAPQRLLGERLDRLHVGNGPLAAHAEVVQVDHRIGLADLPVRLVEDLEAHVLEDRQAPESGIGWPRR